MKRIALFVISVIFVVCACLPSLAVDKPHILGIDHVSFYTTDPYKVKKLYKGLLGLRDAQPVESGGVVRYLVGKQWVGFRIAPNPLDTDRLDHVAFATDNVAALHDYLATKGLKVEAIETGSDHSSTFSVLDPEGRHIEFVERNKSEAPPPAPLPTAVSRHMIHVGFLVHDRDAEDHFYHDLLGFHLYWHGGMLPGSTDWLAMQVPDGTDWLEYMLNHPEHPDLRQDGVLNHISLGVTDMKAAQAILEAHGWTPHGDEKAQMGKDWKWQLNLFDPDWTRVELMEFKPVEKPCCSDFTGPHPSE